nr:DEDD exonuclease domain-containing protein [Sanguibacter gelidistatuariae]
MHPRSWTHEPRPAPGAREAGRRLSVVSSPVVLVSGDLPFPAGRPVQLALDELGTPLHEVTFVVVDLETTGGSPKDSAITEIGAVKVRGGEVIGEFQTLVNPGMPIPAFISRLTGITTAMVASAPRIEAVLPSFLDFARSCVLVAHNAPFDISFLRAATVAMDLTWPGNQVLDTVPLARRLVTRDEAPNHKLGTLAALFRATITPDHRALSDARATVDVMHALFERLAPLGVTTLEDLAGASDPVPPDIRRRRHLADGLPDGPGVYMFIGPGDEVLYVGTSTHVRKRVRSYFTAAEKRRRMTEMIRLASSVRAIPCATELESRVRELRMITEHAPRYNQRSKHPERMHWVRLTAEAHPRLTVVREPPTAGTGVAAAQEPRWATEPHIGPFTSRSRAVAAVEALQAAHQVRQCGGRLPVVPLATATACALAEMGRCSAPCVPTDHGPVSYPDVIDALRATMAGDAGPVVDALSRRIATLVRDERFEDAAADRDRLEAYLSGAARAQRLAPLSTCRQLVAARPATGGGWEIVVVRHGRLAATALCARTGDPLATVASAVASAEHVPPPTWPAPACHPEESDLIIEWLAGAGVRLVDVSDPQSCPVRGTERHVVNTSTAEVVSRSAPGLAHDLAPRPAHAPDPEPSYWGQPTGRAGETSRLDPRQRSTPCLPPSS